MGRDTASKAWVQRTICTQNRKRLAWSIATLPHERRATTSSFYPSHGGLISLFIPGSSTPLHRLCSILWGPHFSWLTILPFMLPTQEILLGLMILCPTQLVGRFLILLSLSHQRFKGHPLYLYFSFLLIVSNTFSFKS